MADFQAIEVDSSYLDGLAYLLPNVGSSLVNSPQGSLSTFVLKAGGQNYSHGANAASRFTTTATSVETLLTGFSTTMSDRASQVRLFRQTTDNTESLNNESGDWFNTHLPGWTNTSGSTPPPTPGTNGPGTNGPGNHNPGNNNTGNHTGNTP